jgi:phosphatidylserine decarboxylase
MSILFSESPYISIAILTLLGISIYVKSNLAIGFSIVLLLFMLYFYRYCPIDVGIINDNEIISPCEGTILDIYHKYGYYYIPIFLSPMNKHTQIYPANCKVLDRKYDKTGEFAIVMDLSKSRNNEKKIHTLLLNNNVVIQLTQIAGFLPRVITSSDELKSYSAGDYLGMIKFGSRVDLLIPDKNINTTLKLLVKKGQSVSIGQPFAYYI